MIDIVTKIIDGRTWTRLCKSAEVHERHGKRVAIDIEYDLALFRSDGAVYCVSNVCPHKREAVLYDGHIENSIVTCPMHGWRYDVRTGAREGGASRLPCYEVMETGGWVYAILQR